LSRIVQPGIKIRHPRGMPGTLGAFALHRSGSIVLIGAEHTITGHWRARLGDPLVIEPTDSTCQGVISLRIKGIEEDLPAVLKEPTDATKGMNVVKYGWKTKKTVGKILDISSSANIRYQDGKIRKLDNLLIVEIEADHGDSGSILLSNGNHKPLGFLEAKHEFYPNICYFIKARTIARKNKLLGFFCPMEIPCNCPKIFREVIKNMIPEGYFRQMGKCGSKDWKRAAKTIGLILPDLEDVEPFGFQQSDAETRLKLGQKVRSVGRLLVNDHDQVVGLVHAGSEQVGAAIPLSRIEAALDLKLIGVFGW